jgi:hypothetical protein
MRRARRPDSLAASIVELLDVFATPVPTHAVRVLLADRGRTVSAEHLGRVAAYEREDFLRTRMPPRLCSAIDADGRLVKPRWWANGDWRLQRRILTEDAKPLWLAMLAERICWDLGQREQPAGPEIINLVRWAITRLGLENRYETPRSREGWTDLRSLVVSAYPGVTHSLDSPTTEQHEAEARLIAAGSPAVDLYFGGPWQPTSAQA